MNKILQKIINWGFYLLFIIVPLILTPWNFELFEFNKMIMVYLLTTVITGAWLGRMVLQGRILFKRTAFDLPLLFFLISQLLSTIFSIDRHTSFWGYYSRFHGGLFSTISYLLLYWALVTNLDRISALRVIYCSCATAILVSLYGIAEHYGIDAHLWIQDVRNRVFSTLGQPNWLSAYLAILTPIMIAFCLSKKGRLNFLYYASFFILAVCFFYTKSQSGLFGIALSLSTFWLLLFFINLKTKVIKSKVFLSSFLIFNLLFLYSFSLVGFSAFPQISNRLEKWGLLKGQPKTTEISLAETNQPAGTSPTEGGISTSEDIRKIVWKGAIDVFKHYPLLGSGVETFAYSYYNFRPKEHNLISEWDFLYNKAHNEFLNFLATTGIVGLGTYLIFIFWFISWSLKNAKQQITTDKSDLSFTSSSSPDADKRKFSLLGLALFSGWLSIPVTNFFGFSVVPVALFFFLIPAMSMVILESGSTIPTPTFGMKNKFTSKKEPSATISVMQKIYLALIFLATCSVLIKVINLWRADYHYAQGEKLNKASQYGQAFQELSKATNLNPSEPVYQNEIAETAASLALFSFQQNDKSNASKFTQVAVLESQQALKTSPKNLNFWKGQTKVFYLLAQADKNYLPRAIDSLVEAVNLAPTDAKLLYNLGIVYGYNKQEEAASEAFRQAIDLKPNYKDARFALAVYLEEKGKIQEAREQLEYILKNLAPNDSASAKLLKELK